MASWWRAVALATCCDARRAAAAVAVGHYHLPRRAENGDANYGVDLLRAQEDAQLPVAQRGWGHLDKV